MYKAFTIILTALAFTVSAFAKVSTNTHADIDLTRMSSTMVYSIVYQMVTDPQKYTGKTIKMKGIFSSYVDEETNRRFFGCVIKDALACCSQGLAFETFKPRKYPKDFPSEGSSITIIGRFDYEKEEDGIGFPIIKDAILFR